jgi:hypothetical protein
MMKIGDKVRLKPGVVGEGQTGVIEKIEPWNLDSPYPDLREGFYSNWPNAVRDGAGRL